MEYPSPDDFEGFAGGCKNEELMRDIQEVMEDHGYNRRFLLVGIMNGSMEIHAPVEPEIFLMMAHAVADAGIEIE
jgi:hypothetical protein